MKQIPAEPANPGEHALAVLARLGVGGEAFASVGLPARSPITGEVYAQARATTAAEADDAIEMARKAFCLWREVPAPVRGNLVRAFGETLRAHKEDLAWLVTLEAGKIRTESMGEVQEMIDMCDFAVGLSRQLHGLAIASERPRHRMMECWHPLGPTGIITSFNFPVAVFAWNAALALVCGNACLWKPSERMPLTALAVKSLLDRAAATLGDVPTGLVGLILGGREMAERLADDARVPLVSATGSTAMGRALATRLAKRFARAILELGGNNAAIVAPSADLDLALRAVAFAAMGTAGQRCTTLRRLLVHEDVYDGFLARLERAYRSVRVGDPREDGILVGPLIDTAAGEAMQRALSQARADGGRVVGGERVLADRYPLACYVRPALVETTSQTELVRRETFAPILYVMRYRELEQAIAWQNDVPHGLASAIFTRSLVEAETFLSASGSDCGIANVNIGPSGAEIGGAFGGEKETGGGREAGSDAWKSYMRRATNTINFGSGLPLAQGVRFDVEE